MKISASSQDYLEAILELNQQNGKVRSIDISEKLGVTRPSVNRAVNVLKKMNLVKQEKYSDIYLTELGMRAAKTVKLKHNLIKKFLVEVLHVDSQIADEDACKIEHSMSLESIEKLKEFLDRRD